MPQYAETLRRMQSTANARTAKTIATTRVPCKLSRPQEPTPSPGLWVCPRACCICICGICENAPADFLTPGFTADGRCPDRADGAFGENGKCRQCDGTGLNTQLDSAQARCPYGNGTGICACSLFRRARWRHDSLQSQINAHVSIHLVRVPNHVIQSREFRSRRLGRERAAETGANPFHRRRIG